MQKEESGHDTSNRSIAINVRWDFAGELKIVGATSMNRLIYYSQASLILFTIPILLLEGSHK